MRRKPARTIAWSSAMATRTTFTPPHPPPPPVGDGERCAVAGADYCHFHAPHPNPLPCGERGSVALKPTRTTFTPLTPTLSPVGRGGALRGNRRGLLSRPSPQPSPLWGEGERCADHEASQRRGPCAELATEHLDPLAHPDEAVAARLRALWTGAVVADRQQQRVGLVIDDDFDAARARVLEDVGDRLLDDPVGGQVEGGGERTLLTFDLERGVQS